ncbi:hypothetical protein PAXRUDRAFT_294563 [Paxillus rubicundulus Ve08.2h10]|uniref:Uncharacterized protein n=1 Tax=Paxillus rubicundulus Ve08.2h10 TaxID=930991 RepID=A0A0D0E080_9AGAM|nr:hypothetical protein PAXRUDRAFT_294563 [Paxillus rubicundulus Ve08.2h10]
MPRRAQWRRYPRSSRETDELSTMRHLRGIHPFTEPQTLAVIVLQFPDSGTLGMLVSRESLGEIHELVQQSCPFGSILSVSRKQSTETLGSASDGVVVSRHTAHTR